MRRFITLGLFCLTAFSVRAQEFSLEIPAGQSLEIDLPDMKSYRAFLRNSPFSSLEVSVRVKHSGEQLRGFGLSPGAKADLLVEKDAYLHLQNSGKKSSEINLSVQHEANPQKENKQKQYVNLVLLNTGLRSIPLQIPGVMNPNLSPLSRSNVTLKMGQEILFRNGLKRHVLLVVTDSIKPGAELNITKLLSDKKKELKLD